MTLNKMVSLVHFAMGYIFSKSHLHISFLKKIFLSWSSLVRDISSITRNLIFLETQYLLCDVKMFLQYLIPNLKTSTWYYFFIYLLQPNPFTILYFIWKSCLEFTVRKRKEFEPSVFLLVPVRMSQCTTRKTWTPKSQAWWCSNEEIPKLGCVDLWSHPKP